MEKTKDVKKKFVGAFALDLDREDMMSIIAACRTMALICVKNGTTPEDIQHSLRLGYIADQFEAVLNVGKSDKTEEKKGDEN